MATLKCRYKQCGRSFPIGLERCPHCARPGVFSNVEEAKLGTERTALAKRHKAARESAAARNCEAQVLHFEKKLADSQAVINRSALETARLASSDREFFSTFYQLLTAEVRLPAGEVWDRLRRQADEALFPGYKEKIRFAALSLDGTGLVHYGDCALVLRQAMIAHRASVFHENSTLFLRRHHYTLPPGYRAVWRDRVKLCIAKLAAQVQELTSEAEFPTLLLQSGPTSAKDQFIEVHIWGPLSVYSLEQVGISRRFASLSPALLLAVQEFLDEANVKWKIV